MAVPGGPGEGQRKARGRPEEGQGKARGRGRAEEGQGKGRGRPGEGQRKGQGKAKGGPGEGQRKARGKAQRFEKLSEEALLEGPETLSRPFKGPWVQTNAFPSIDCNKHERPSLGPFTDADKYFIKQRHRHPLLVFIDSDLRIVFLRIYSGSGFTHW